MLLKVSQHIKLFWAVAFFVCFVFVAVNRDDFIQGTLAAEPPALQKEANDSKEAQQENGEARQKKKFIRWLKEHHVFDGRFWETDPEKAKPTEWDEKLEKDIYRLPLACLWDEKIRDEDMRYLSKCPALYLIALNTDTTKLSAKGLRHLRGLKKLKWVYFSGTQPVPAEWVKSLASFDRIEFWVFRAPVTDDALLALTASRSTIKDINLFNATPLTVKGYRAIGGLTGLKSLHIMCMKPKDRKVGVQLSDKEIHGIARCPNLRNLSIMLQDGGVELSVRAAKDLASMPKLQCMTLDCFSAPPEEVLAILGQRSWISIGLDWPSLSAKAKQENKNPLDMSRKLIEEAASRASSGRATSSNGSKDAKEKKIVKPKNSKTPR